MIKCLLELCHYMGTFCAVNQRLAKQTQDENDDNGSVYWNTLTLSDWDTLKELYDLIKSFRDLIIYIKSYITNGSYGALWEVMPAIELLVLE